jgi:hypothetical protein
MTKKRLLKLILTILLIIGIITGITYTILLNQLTDTKAKELVVNAYDTSSIISAAKGFDGYVRDLKYQVVISDNNLFNSKISLIRASFYPTDSTKDLYDIFTLYFKRTGFNTWEVKEYKYSTSTNLSFEKIVNYVKSQDIYTNNPDKANIRNVPPLTPQEIEQNRRVREESAISQKKQDDRTNTLTNGTPDQKLEILEKDNIFLKEYIEAYDKYILIPKETRDNQETPKSGGFPLDSRFIEGFKIKYQENLKQVAELKGQIQK